MQYFFSDENFDGLYFFWLRGSSGTNRLIRLVRLMNCDGS